MEKHTCKTYFSVNFNFDTNKNETLSKECSDCLPEDIGIFNKTQVEKFIIDNFDVQPKWRRHRFLLDVNEIYSVDVNDMIRITLKNLLGKENKIKELCQSFGVKTSLVVVPYIASETEEAKQNLSLDKDIIDFLYESGTSIDLDYYVI